LNAHSSQVPWSDTFRSVASSSSVASSTPSREEGVGAPPDRARGAPPRREVSFSVPQDPRLRVDSGAFGHVRGATVLRGITLEVGDGELVMVAGAVGAGKSSLLASLLGETIKVDGRVSQRGSIAYVAQEPWILNASLRDNVLPPPRPPPRTKWTRRVPHPVLIGHAASLPRRR
jgi:ABC-type multidrug transport system fused ATPase/permease subunit